jgi:hypothetical protein
MADIKVDTNIADLNHIGVRTKGRPKNRWREVINDANKLKLRKWSQPVKDRKARN